MDDISKRKIERAQKKLDELRSRRKRYFWNAKPIPATNYIRILPNWNGDQEGNFYRETGFHRKLGESRDKSAVCLLREGLDQCPVCEIVKELFKTKNLEDKELAKSIKVQNRVFYNIIDMNDIKRGVQQWVSGVDVLEQILGFCDNAAFGYIPSAENGRNIELTLIEGENSKSGFNEYTVQPDPDKSILVNMDFINHLIDLDSLVKISSFEEIESLLKTFKSKISVEEKQSKGLCFGKFNDQDDECKKCVVLQSCQISVKPVKPIKPVKKSKDKSAKNTSDIAVLFSKLRGEK